MALTTIPKGGTGGATILSGNSTTHPYARLPNHRHVIFPRRTLHVVSAKKFSSRSSKNRRTSTTTTTKDQLELDQDQGQKRTAEIKRTGDDAGSSAVDDADDGYFLPKLPGDEPDFWEGEQWDALGFFVEYLWAFGIVFAYLPAEQTETSTRSLQSRGSCRAREVLRGSELQMVSFRTRQRHCGCCVKSCLRLSQHIWDGDCAEPCTNGPQGASGSSCVAH